MPRFVFKQRLVVVGSLVLLLLLTGFLPQPHPVLAAATVTLDPLSGLPGATVHATGSGWVMGDHIEVRWEAQDLLVQTIINNSGGFDFYFTVPFDATSGSRTIYFNDVTNGSSLTQSFIVEPPDSVWLGNSQGGDLVWMVIKGSYITTIQFKATDGSVKTCFNVLITNYQFSCATNGGSTTIEGHYLSLNQVAGTYTNYGQQVQWTAMVFSQSVSSIRGQITDSANAPMAGVTVSVAGPTATTTTTDLQGNYVLDGLTDGNYTITPSKSGYTFSPSYLSATVPPNVIGKNFLGSQTSTQKSWTLMYFIAADNDGTEQARLQAQYDSLKDSSKNPNVNVVAFWDGLNLKDTKYVAWASSNETSNIHKEELNTGDPTTLHDFITWAQQNYPADHYALIISDHGSLSGVALDATANFSLGDYLTQNDLHTALSGVKKLDVVYMDACLMGNIETAYQLRNIADFYVASESETWNGILPELFTLGSKQSPYPVLQQYDIPGIQDNTSPEQLATNMGKSYDILGRYFWRKPSTISVAKLSNVSDVVTKTSTLAGLLKSGMTSLHGIIKSITPYNVLQHYEMDRDLEITNQDEYVDLYQFAELVQTNISDPNIQSAAQELMTSVNGYIIYEDHWSGPFFDEHHKNHYWYHANSHGVSIFFPQFSRSFYKDSWSDFTAGTTWNINGSQTMLTVPNSAATIEWGPMLVEYVRDTNPNVPDNPGPPQLLAAQMSHYFISLPLLRR